MIKIHYSLLFIIILSIITDCFTKVFLILLTIILHEIGHMIAIKIFNGHTTKLELSIIGGFLKIDKSLFTLKQKIIVDLSGIIMNIVIVVILIFLHNDALNYLIKYNIIMIIFNIIPIIPLDGYQIVYDILISIYEEEYATVLSKRISFVFLMLLFVVIMFLKIWGLYLIWLYLLIKTLTTKHEYNYLTNLYKLYKYKSN